VLLLAVAVGTTLAFVFTKTNPVENTFTPSNVACAVVEDINDTETSKEVVSGSPQNIEIAKKSNVKIKNTGDTDAYIRVAVVVTWKNANGNVYAFKPVEGADYEIDWAYDDDNPTAWEKGLDGFYYYTKSVPAVDDTTTNGIDETLTGILINSAKQLKACATNGYYLSIEIVASAIQANGMGATSAQDAWVKAVEPTTGN
jgi:hypothetical protein